MINILFIHQSAEMYGSDKTLLLLLKNLDKNKFKAVVILPNDGVLKTELEKENIEVVIAPVLKLYRKMFTPKNILIFFKDYKKAISVLYNLHQKHTFNLVYSNTLATLIGLFFARKIKIKHLWHVHEIIEKPVVFYKGFCKLLALKSNTKIVYNSIATGSFWNVNTLISNKSKVIWNGLEINQTQISVLEKQKIRQELFDSKNEIIIALVGRISRWKGQMILLEAFNILLKTQSNIKLAFVGSPPPNQEEFLDNLKTQITNLELTNNVVVIPFQDDISKIWQSIDIAVVASTEPEPFGLVAVEAMLAKKPVIGSNHGGLTEIIVDNETGFLITPNDEKALANALSKLINDENLRAEMGENGYQRAVAHFSVDQYVGKFEQLFDQMGK